MECWEVTSEEVLSSVLRHSVVVFPAQSKYLKCCRSEQEVPKQEQGRVSLELWYNGDVRLEYGLANRCSVPESGVLSL